MNTPFSKKELEMFANIEGDIYVADAESDYDFFAKAYEEGIASTNVPENALPHLYTEVQRGESGDENTDKVEFEAGYFREWINTVLSNQDTMNAIAEDYENVAILDSVVDEENALDSKNPTTSAFEILMAYANRENLFPMNINIEVGVDKETPSDLMLQAEEVGMVDDIVKMLMGDGDVTDSTSSEDFADYGDWNWDGMGELGKDLAEQGNVDYSLAEEDDEVIYSWITVVSIIKMTGNNYDYSKKYEKEYDGEARFSSESGELYKEFRDAMEASKVKDFYKSGITANFEPVSLYADFINYMFEDINEFIEDKDWGSDGKTYPQSKDYNSIKSVEGSVYIGDEYDTRVNVEYTQDSDGYTRITVQQWQEV